jgi:precorrin-6A/cobalt-precorrin-6A reductase
VILLLGGTSDARELAGGLRRAGYDVRVSTASAYGARLAGPDAAVRGGATADDWLDELVAKATALVDATHPFAEQISVRAAAECAEAGLPYLRFLRPAGELPASAVRAADAEEAACVAVERARETGGAILLTVGSRTLRVYVRAARRAGVRLVARVLPTAESLKACEEVGLEPRDVVAMQGPPSAELDAALLRHLGAGVLVTKESGTAGGLGEKLRAAELVGAVAVVVMRPAEQPADDASAEARSSVPAGCIDDVLEWLRTQPGVERASRPAEAPAGPRRDRHLARGLLQVYTGDGKGKTTAAVGQALRAAGAGLAVTFVQFVKGGRESSELAPLRGSGVEVVRPASARSGLLRGEVTSEDRAAAAAAWAAAGAALSDPTRDLVVLDELHAALRHGLVGLPEVLAAIAARPPRQEVVTTGRGAAEELLAAADLVTRMDAVRHPYPDVLARRGIEL